MRSIKFGALEVRIGRPQRGRPTVYGDWSEALRAMDELVRSGVKPNAAAESVAQEHFGRMASGSRHIQRNHPSTVRMLKKHYPMWVVEQKRLQKIVDLTRRAAEEIALLLNKIPKGGLFKS